MEVAAQRMISTDSQALALGAIFFLFIYLPGLVVFCFFRQDDPDEAARPSSDSDSDRPSAQTPPAP